MNKFNKAVLFGFVFVAAIVVCGQAFSQTTITVGGLTTGTYGQITQTTSFAHVNITGSDRRVPMSELAKAVLSNLTISNGGSSILSFTGINASGTTTLGVLTLTQTTTGVLTLSNLGVGSAATVTSAIYANTTVSGREGLRIQGVAGQTGILLNCTNSSGTSLFNIDPIYGLSMRHATTTNMMSVGPAGTQIWSLNSSTTVAYQRQDQGSGIAFSTAALSGTSVCLSSTSPGILQVTDTGSARSTLATGGFGIGFRALSSSSQLTVTDGIVSLTGAITGTLPDATTLTGRMVIAKNIGGVTATISGTSAAQTLDGNTTLSVPASSSLRLISTGTVWISY